MEPSSKWFDLSVLQGALKAFLDATDDNALESIRLAVDKITSRGSIETTKTDLTADAAAAFFKCIVQAYAVKVFNTKTAACGPLAQILSWFVTKLSPNQRRAVYEILFYQKEYDASMLSVTAVTRRKGPKPKLGKKTGRPSPAVLLEVFSIRNLTDQEIEAVLNLLIYAIKGDSDSDDSMSSKTRTGESSIEDEILASKELLSLFLNRSLISDVSQGGTSAQTTEEIQADEQTDVSHNDSGPSEDQEGQQGHASPSGTLLLTVMNICPSEDAFAALLSNLNALYSGSVTLKKPQLHRILEKMLSLGAVDASAVFLRGMKSERVDNVALISDIAEYLFATPVLYLTSPVLSFDNICEIISFCAERIVSETPLHVPDVFSVFAKHSKAKDGNNQWICERLHLLSLFFSDEMQSVPASSINEVFVKALFNVFLTLEDQMQWEDVENLHFDVFSELKTICEYCHKNASFPIFSCLLKVSQLNSEVFARLSNDFCTHGILHRWGNQPDTEDVIALLELCKGPQSESVEWLLMALESLLKSEAGRNEICSSQRSDADWIEVCGALLNTSSSSGMFVAVNAVPVVVRLACTLDKDECRHPINALMSEIEQFLRAEIRSDDFAAFLAVLANSSVSVLNEVIASACSAAAGMERIEDVQFFSHLYTYLTDPASQEREPLKVALFSELGGLFGLMRESVEKGKIDSLTELIYLLLEDRNASVDRKETCPSDKYDDAIPPFSSARFPTGQSIQSETASLMDLKRMIETFGRPNLSLESSDLRNAVLQTHTPPCKEKEEGAAKSKESCRSMILTATTEENIAMIQEAVADGNPILLIGSTGMGKTATLMEVCRRKGVEFVRINMSSDLTPEDFLAKVTMGSHGEIVQDLQPFAKSFKNGTWVLLDKMNLAEEGALKVVIDAMESGEIAIRDQSSALSSTTVIKKHPDFRLFAAQNPWQAGKRERLSDAFLSQFSIMHFKDLPRDEWREIVEEKIAEGRGKDPEISRKLAARMTDFHCDVKEKIAEGCSEKGSYATITNRELLMWTDMVLAEKQLVRAEKRLGDHAWLIYGCRFRGDGRQLVQKVIGDHNLVISSAGSRLEDAIERFSRIQAPCLKKHITLVDQFWTTHFSNKPFPDEDARKAFNVCATVHRAVLKKIQSPDFMKTFGVYTTFSESWLAKWIADALDDRLLGTDDWTGLGRLGAETYCLRIRHDQARRDVFGVFAQQFDLDLGDVPTMASSVPEMPVVLSDQLCQHLVSVAEAIRSEQPVLIEGTAGSGKTCLGKVIAFLLGNHYEQVTLTQESEPSAILGECLPSISLGSKSIVQWRDGPLTRAFVEGSVCIVDNIGQAEPVLLERINPVLESPKVLCLTERGDTVPLRCRVLANGEKSSIPGPARGFQFIATFTPRGVASRGMDILSKELTIDLFNHFVTIHIDDPASTSDDELRGALEAMIRCCLPGERCEASLRAISDYCLKIKHFVSENAQMFLSFRDFVTLIDVATVLMTQRPDVEDQVALHCAMTVTFAAQMRDAATKRSLCSALECPGNVLNPLKLLDGFEKSSDLVLTESRKGYAQAVLLGALVNKPVLLEGKPAVGKMSLVLGLKGFGGPDKAVRILSNSDTTTIQDYFGTWIPSDNGFSFQKGILVQAMESGDWFVSDKFNLAPVAVIAALMPFLEGNCTVQIPGSDIRVGVHPDFRFFATQNPSRGGNDGRKQLPITVRNRFLTVDVEDFPRDELPEIVRDKFRGGRYQGIAEEMDPEALAKLYFAPADGFRLTMRDIVKIVRRYKLLRDEGPVTWAKATMSLLGPRATTKEETASLMHLIESSFGSGGVAEAMACASKYIKQEHHGVSFCQGYLRIHFPGFKLDNSPLWRDSLFENGPPAVFQDKLVDLAFAMKANEPVLLFGESAFKTELIKTWLELSGMTERVQRVHLTSQSEASDLIGQVQPVSFVDVLENLASTGSFILSYLILHLTAKTKSRTEALKNVHICHLRQRLLRGVSRFKRQLYGKDCVPDDKDGFSPVNASDSIRVSDQNEQTSSDDDGEDDYSGLFEIPPDGSVSNESNADGFSPANQPNSIHASNQNEQASSDDDGEDDYSGLFEIPPDSSVSESNADRVDGSEDYEKEYDARGSMSAYPDGCGEDLDSLREKSADLTEDDHLIFIDGVILRISALVHEILGEEIPATMKRVMHRLGQLRMFIRSRDVQNSKPCFLFRDGPFVKAITMEHAFVVEDYDLCAQAVTERLNSALEVDPTFSIPEDATFLDRVAAEMEIPKKGYCFIATSHLDSANKKPQLSAATQSRLTQIGVPVYGTHDIMSIAEEKLRSKLHASEVKWLPYVMDSIRCVRSEVVGDDPEHPCEDFRGILRWIMFVTEHPRDLSIEKRCMLGAKFFYLAGYPTDIQNEVLRKIFTEEFEKLQYDLALPMGDNPFEIEETAGDAGRVVSLMGYRLSLSVPSTLETSSGDNRLPELSLCVTPSVRENMARMFASICTNSPLLLEGAPGVGKTAIITQVARFLGTDLERIDCSGDTSVEQLYGSVMPMYVDNCKVFKWRDGKLLKALKSEKWILLNEVNLLPAQVLESLLPLLNGSAVADGFSVPGKLDSEPIPVHGTRMFATMNPAAEGRGRTKLSRSIKNTFAVFQIEGYDNDDLKQILKKQFEGLTKKELLGEEDLQHVFDVYKKVEQSMEKGEIQGASCRHRLNLRDLKSVHDIVAGNIETQISHHRLMACDDDAKESEQDFDKKPVVTSVIRKALQLVFKHRFDNRSAEEQIQRTIDEVVKPSQMEGDQSDSPSIDLSVGDLVRIGNVYMEKDKARASQGSLVHTVKTIRQLELLATASQSQRAVLLEGPTCSKKTSLVKELASLVGVPLLVLSLHRDLEVSDLIGQWLPVSSSDIVSELSKNVFRLRDDVARLGLGIAEKAPQKKSVDFYRAMQVSYAKNTSTVTSQEMEQDVKNVKLALEMLKECNLTKWQSLMRTADELKESMMSSEDASSSIVFKFVESDLIKALKAGSFILFDNINAASPDVIERLLSLFAETPFLSLYEQSEGEELKPGAGIHPTTRIFATADRKKINTFGFSNPLLNRMIKIWLPEIDGDVLDLDLILLESHETVEIASEALGSVEGGNGAAILAVTFHARVRQLAQTSQVTITRDSKISFRMLQQAISVIRTWLDKGEPLFNAVVWGLWRVYAAVVETDEGLKKLQHAMQQSCEDAASILLHKFDFASSGRDALGKLVAELEIPVSRLQENELGDFFKLKDQYKKQSKAENIESGLARASHLCPQAEEVPADISAVFKSKPGVQANKVTGLKREFQNLWKKAKSQSRPATSVMQEAVKAVQALDRLKGDERNVITLARYENTLQNLRIELDKPQPEKTGTKATQSIVSKDLLDLLSKRSHCLEAVDLSLVVPSLLSRNDHFNVKQLDDLIRQMEKAIPELPEQKKAVDDLIHMVSSRHKQSLWEETLEAIRECWMQQDADEGCNGLRELSNLNTFSEALSTRLAFQASRESYDALLRCAVGELIQMRIEYLSDEYSAMLSKWTSGEGKKALEAVLALCSDERLSMVHTYSILEALKHNSKQLNSCLKEQAISSKAGLCFACPGLFAEDAAILFSVDSDYLYKSLMNPSLSTKMHASSAPPSHTGRTRHCGFLSSLAYHQADGGLLPVLPQMSNTMDNFLRVFDDLRLKQLERYGGQDDDRFQASQEILTAFQFIVVPLLLFSEQDFSHLEPSIQLSSSEQEQKRVDDIQESIRQCQLDISNLQEEVEREESEREMYTSTHMYRQGQRRNTLKKAIAEATEELKKKQSDLKFATAAADSRRSRICQHLLDQVRALLTHGLRCFCDIVQSDALESLWKEESAVSMDAPRPLCQAVLIDIQNLIENEITVSKGAKQEFEKWAQSYAQFSKGELKQLSNDDPFRRAIEISCKCAFVGNQRTLQRISIASKAHAANIYSLMSVGEDAENLVERFTQTCMHDYSNGSEIVKLSNRLLQLEQKYRSLEEVCVADDPRVLHFAYLRNLILHSVSCCCSYAHRMHPMRWYEETLLPRLEESVKEKVLLSMPSSDEDELKAEMTLLPCSWASHRTSLQTSIVEGTVVNPFQLTYVLEQCFAVNAPLYQSASYAGQLFVRGILEFWDTLRNISQANNLPILTAEECQNLGLLVTQLPEMCVEPLPAMTVERTHQRFSELSARIIELTNVMLQTRKNPTAYLAEYLGKICEQWWYETASMCLQKPLVEYRAAVEVPLSQRISDAAFVVDATSLKSILLLGDFQDTGNLLENLCRQGLDLFDIKFGNEQFEHLRVLSSVLDQVLTLMKQRLLDNWHAYPAFAFARTPVTQFDKFLNAHHVLMKTKAKVFLQEAGEIDENTKGVLIEACCMLHHLCSGIHQEIANWIHDASAQLLEDSQSAEKLSADYASAHQDYEDNAVLFIEERQKRHKDVRHSLNQDLHDAVTNEQRDICSELLAKASELYLDYCQLWKQIRLYLRNPMGRNWFRVHSAATLKLCGRVSDVSRKQQWLGQKHLCEDINLADYGLKFAIVVLNVNHVRLDASPSFGFVRIQIKCTKGGAGPPLDLLHGVRSEVKFPILYGVFDEEGFELTLTVSNNNTPIGTKTFKLQDISSSNIVEAQEAQRSQRTLRVTFEATKLVALTVKATPLPSDNSRQEQVANVDTSEMIKLTEQINAALNVHEQKFDELHIIFAKGNSLLEKEANESLRLVNADRAAIENNSHTQSIKQWQDVINKICDFQHKMQSHLSGPQNSWFIDSGSKTINGFINELGKPVRKIQAMDYEESRLRLVDLTYSEEDVSSVWTSQMQASFLKTKEGAFGMQLLGERSLASLLSAAVLGLCKSSLSVTSKEDLVSLDKALQEWKVMLKDSPLSSNQKEAIAFKAERYCCSALSIADARIQCTMSFERAGDEHQRIMQLNRRHNPLLPGTKLHHSAKLIVTQSDTGICVLDTDHLKVDFGTHLYAADDKKSGSNAQVCVVEVVNRTASTMIVSVAPAKASSEWFSVLAPNMVRLYRRSTRQFSFRVNDKAVGRICERWRIESPEAKLNDCFELCANLQRLAVHLSAEEIDFGVLLPDSEQQKRVICIRNVTDLPLLIKGQIQSNKNRCALSMSPEKMLLLPRKTQSLEFTLKPSATKENVESTIVIGAVHSFKYLKLKAKIGQPKFELLDEMDKKVIRVFGMQAVKKGKKGTGCLRVKNVGDVPVAFSIDWKSDALKIEPSVGTVPVGSEMPVRMKMKCPDNSDRAGFQTTVSVVGCRERQVTTCGRWIDPVPSFYEKTVEFKITTEQLVHMVKEDERSSELTARNKLINRDDIPVTVYPPKSDDFVFDQPHYSFEGKGEIDFEMTWTVRRLKKQEHTVTFLTETGKKLSFEVNLIWASGKLEINPTSWIQLNPVKPGKATRRDIIKIHTTGPFSILNKAPQSELIETLSLTELHNGRPIREQGPWLLGSDDMSTVFRSSKQFDISVKTKEGRGWIVEDLVFQTDQAVFVHEDPEKCQLMKQKLTIVVPVSDEPNALASLMESCKKSVGCWPAGRNAAFCLPNLDILSEMSTSPSSVQSFLLMMLCEVEILQKEWKLTTEQARCILDSDPDEAISLCAGHLKHLEQAPRGNAGSSSNLVNYFDKLKDHFEVRGHDHMSEICIPLAAVSNAPFDIRTIVQAVYMLLHADCPEKQQWKAAVAVMKTTMPDAFSVTQFDSTCNAIAELLNDEELTLSDVLTLLNSLLISDNEEIISLDLLGKILWTFDSSDDDANLDQVIANALPEHAENGRMLLQASSPDQSDRLELMMSLVSKTIKQAVDQLCSEDPKAVVAGFCDLVQTSDVDLMEDSLISDLVSVMSGKNAQKMNSLGRNHRMDHERSTITQFLKRAKLESVALPLCGLYGHRTEDKAKRFARRITVEALFDMLPRCLNGRQNRTLKHIRNAALEVSDDPYAPSSYLKDIIIDRELIGINNVERRLKLKGLIKKWIKSDPRRDGMESLLKPLIEAVNEVLCPNEGSSSETPPANLQPIEEQVIRALTELDPPTISREMAFNELFARVIRFCSLLTDDNIEHMEVANRFSALVADATKENAICFCGAIAKELSSYSLNSALELLEEGIGDDENLQEMVLHCVMPEQMVDEFDAVIESWSGIDSDVNEEEVFKKMEKLSEPAVMTTFKLVGVVLKARNSVTHMDESEIGSIEGLLTIKTLFDSLAVLGCWEKREKSRAAWNILLSASAVGYGAELTFEGLCLAKMSLLLSLTEFYGKRHWMKRESPSCADDRCLKLEIADVPEELPSGDNSEEEEAVSAEIVSADEAKRSVDEKGAAFVLEDGEWHWLLDNFEVPEKQLVPLEGESSRNTEMSVTENRPMDQAGDVCAERSSGYMEKLAVVEGILEAVMESVADASASPSEDSSLGALTFDRIVDGITKVKTAADTWTEIFEKAVRRSPIPKKEERNADSRVVCAGLSLISQIQFFERYLERCSLFEIPGFVKDVLDGIVQYLNAIPKSNLPAEFDKILREFGVTTIVKGSTTEDFPMPPRDHFISQTEKDADCGNDYRAGGSSSSCLALPTGNADEATLVDTTKSAFLKKVTDTVMSRYTTEPTSSVKPQSLLDQKIGAVDFDLDEGATHQSVRNADQTDKDATITRADVDKRELQDPVSVVPVHRDRWTYSLLVESKPFVLVLMDVMRQWEAHFEKFYRSTAEKHKTEWCILVNNSESMITKEFQMTEAVVLAMEALNRQEQPFAVARFGNRRSQQMLKLMNEPFTQLIGQKILESFSFDEGTCPASAVRHVAEKVWPTGIYGNDTFQYHRVMLLITDGLTQERFPEDYTSICKEKEFEFVVLNLNDEAQKETMRQIEGLWSKVASCYEVLDVRSIDLLPQLLAGLMIQYMENTLSKIERNRHQLRSIKWPVIQARCIDNVNLGVNASKLLENFEKQSLPKLPGSFSKKSFFDCGCATDGILYATEMRRLLSTDLELDVVALDHVERELLDLHHSLQVLPENKEHLKIAEAVWMKAESWLRVEIAHMVEALEGFLPQNRYTRKRVDIQGPYIHLPRFMKHIATQGNEKKIFVSKKGEGKSEYAVAVLLDISASMAQGRRRSCALQTVVMLISALKQMSIEDFSVILFGEGIYPIKLPDDAWEAPSIALLFSAVLQGNELSSVDADALLFAAQLLDQSSVRGPKKIFVVTDGYGSSGVRLAGVLHKIEEDLGVDVLAMGVGPEEFFVKKCYPKWITAALPQMVPDALESMSDKMESAGRRQKTNQKDTIDWQSIASFKDGAAETVEEVLRNKETAFPELLEAMKTEREAKLKRGNKPSTFTVDICFVLDRTGSMMSWMNAAKEQIQIKEKYPDIELEFRFAMVAYKDYGDDDQLIFLPFTDKMPELHDALRQLTAGGGSDIPEDVLGALKCAADFDGWQSKVRFCVLIGDAPGHGRNLNDLSDDRYPYGDPYGLTASGVMEDLKEKEIHLLFCRITQKTDKMIREFARHYNDGVKFELTSKDVFGDCTANTQRSFHFVFCLNESQSMGGQPWQDVCNAFQHFLQKRVREQATSDLVSVIQFDHNARIAMQGVPLREDLKLLPCRSGGTRFIPALNIAKSIVLNSQTAHIPVLVFVSNEAGGTRESVLKKMKELVQHCPSLNVHTIGFGHGAAHSRLQEMAAVAGGQYHQAITGIDLSNNFSSISNSRKAVDALASEFGKVIGDMVSSPTILGHL